MKAWAGMSVLLLATAFGTLAGSATLGAQTPTAITAGSDPAAAPVIGAGDWSTTVTTPEANARLGTSHYFRVPIKRGEPLDLTAVLRSDAQPEVEERTVRFLLLDEQLRALENVEIPTGSMHTFGQSTESQVRLRGLPPGDGICACVLEMRAWMSGLQLRKSVTFPVDLTLGTGFASVDEMPDTPVATSGPGVQLRGPRIEGAQTPDDAPQMIRPAFVSSIDNHTTRYYAMDRLLDNLGVWYAPRTDFGIAIVSLTFVLSAADGSDPIEMHADLGLPVTGSEAQSGGYQVATTGGGIVVPDCPCVLAISAAPPEDVSLPDPGAVTIDFEIVSENGVLEFDETAATTTVGTPGATLVAQGDGGSGAGNEDDSSALPLVPIAVVAVIAIAVGALVVSRRSKSGGSQEEASGD